MFAHIYMNKLDATTIKNIAKTLEQELFKVVYLLSRGREINVRLHCYLREISI